jgi:diguanylate cyclase (GGDEF)-like protein
MTSPGVPSAPERWSQSLSVLNEIAKALTSTLQLPEVMRIVLARIKTFTFAEAISLLLYDAQRDELVFSATETLRESTFQGLRIPPERGIAAWVARTGQSALVNEAANDSRCAGPEEPLPPCDGHHLLAVPIKRAGQVFAVVEVADRYDGRPFVDDDLQTLERAAAAMCERVDAYRQSRRPEDLRGLLAEIVAAVPTQAAALLLFEPQGNTLTFSASRKLQAGVIDGLRMSTERGIAGWVARHRQPVLLEDASLDPRYDPTIEARTSFRSHSMICVPMISKNDLLGVIQVINRIDGKAFDEDELRMVQTLADYAAIAIENALLYNQAQVSALTDDLTGLGNSRQLNRVLPDLLARGRKLAVLVLDFDNFKQIVDRYGHLIGAQTIGYVGRLMGRLIRPGDIAARFGGDEFAVLLPDTPVETALQIAEALRAAIEECQALDGQDVDLSTLTASIGVASYPEHAATADGLLHAADQAMYEVKRARKNGVALARLGIGT